MDKLVKDLMKEGMSIQEILNMPYNYIVDILSEKVEQAKHSNSFFDLLG